MMFLKVRLRLLFISLFSSVPSMIRLLSQYSRSMYTLLMYLFKVFKEVLRVLNILLQFSMCLAWVYLFYESSSRKFFILSSISFSSFCFSRSYSRKAPICSFSSSISMFLSSFSSVLSISSDCIGIFPPICSLNSAMVLLAASSSINSSFVLFSSFILGLFLMLLARYPNRSVLSVSLSL